MARLTEHAEAIQRRKDFMEEHPMRNAIMQILDTHRGFPQMYFGGVNRRRQLMKFQGTIWSALWAMKSRTRGDTDLFEEEYWRGIIPILRGYSISFNEVNEEYTDNERQCANLVFPFSTARSSCLTAIYSMFICFRRASAPGAHSPQCALATSGFAAMATGDLGLYFGKAVFGYLAPLFDTLIMSLARNFFADEEDEDEEETGSCTVPRILDGSWS